MYIQSTKVVLTINFLNVFVIRVIFEILLSHRHSSLKKCNVILSILYPFPKQHILDSSEQKDFADDNFKYDKNGRNFFKQVENTVGKGEIAFYKQFLLFPQCFQKTCTVHK